MEMMRIEHGLIEDDISPDQMSGALEKNNRKQLGLVPKIIPLVP